MKVSASDIVRKGLAGSDHMPLESSNISDYNFNRHPIPFPWFNTSVHCFPEKQIFEHFNTMCKRHSCTEGSVVTSQHQGSCLILSSGYIICHSLSVGFLLILLQTPRNIPVHGPGTLNCPRAGDAFVYAWFRVLDRHVIQGAFLSHAVPNAFVTGFSSSLTLVKINQLWTINEQPQRTFQNKTK